MGHLWHLYIGQVQKAVDGTWYAYLHDHGISGNNFVDEHTVGIILTVTFPNSVQDIMYNTCTF